MLLNLKKDNSLSGIYTTSELSESDESIIFEKDFELPFHLFGKKIYDCHVSNKYNLVWIPMENINIKDYV